MTRILVVGATGHVGSHIVRILAEQDHDVRAMVRGPDRRVEGAPETVEYVQGDLNDPASLRAAVKDIEVVLSTANAIIPRSSRDDVSKMNLGGYQDLITACEEAGVRQFIQSSVPSHPIESKVPELAGKRAIEARLASSPMSTVAVRNPAFMDVWIVMCGVSQAMGQDPHATTRRPYGFMKFYLGLVGDLATRRGILLAPGGPDAGSVFISARDVAHMMAGCVDHPDVHNVTIEAGGPEWRSWRELAGMLSERLGRPVHPVTMPAWLPAMGRASLKHIWPSASNVLALTQFVATYQPTWDASSWVERLGLPPQQTFASYLDENLVLTGATP